MSEILAIETEYNGIRFRSRLEARWAVFFDTLGVVYEYEKEGYSLPPIPMEGIRPDKIGALQYLPDFYIPAQRAFPKPLWAEVKGVMGKHDAEKLTRLCYHTKIRGTFLRDVPHVAPCDRAFDGCYPNFTLQDRNDEIIGPEVGVWDEGYCFCQCPFCGAFGFEFNGRSARVGCKCPQHAQNANGDKTYNDGAPALVEAYSAARRERFGT